MKLLRIQSIKKHRIFRDFTWPKALPDFARYNVIYGWNGAGKSTLSHLLTHLEHRTEITEGEVTFKLDSGDVKGSSIASSEIPHTRVFNHKFVRDNLSKAGGAFSPIFILGEKNTAKQAEVEGLTTERDNIAQKLPILDKDWKSAADALDKFCTEAAVNIKTELRSRQSHRYNNYNKKNLFADLNSLDKISAVQKELPEKEKSGLREQLEANSKALLMETSLFSSDPSRLLAESEKALSTSVVERAADPHADHPLLRAWIESGLKLHDSEGESCEFCGGPLSPARRASLEARFDESERALKRELERLLRQSRDVVAGIQRVEFPDALTVYGELRDDYLGSMAKVVSAAKVLEEKHQTLQSELEERTLRVFRTRELPVGLGDALTEATSDIVKTVERINVTIRLHNEKTANFDHTVADARGRLAWAMIADAFDEHRKLAVQAQEAKVHHQNAKVQDERLLTRIKTLEHEMRQHREAGEDLSKDLRSYLGRGDLTFVAEKNGYSLRRHEHPAEHLSEGEKTAIAFLYFLKSLEDESFKTEEGIVVIDDPVSSLDSNSLFSAFGYMKERVASCGQVFILTHNFSFLRNVKQWLKYERESRCYQLRATTDRVGLRYARLEQLDPVLQRFESEYHYLFKLVAEAETSGDLSPEESFPLPNLVRRLLEAFLAFRFPSSKSGLRGALRETKFEESRKTRLLRFAHTHSHADHIHDGAPEPWSASEVHLALGDVMELIKSEDAGHYDGMLKELGLCGDAS